MSTEQLTDLIRLLGLLSEEEWKKFSETIKKMANEGIDIYSLTRDVGMYEELREALELLNRFCKTKRGDHCNLNYTWKP